MKTQEIPVAGKTSFIVTVEEEAVVVHKVIVIVVVAGYGTQNNSDIILYICWNLDTFFN
jgi:hypothetical protein